MKQDLPVLLGLPDQKEQEVLTARTAHLAMMEKKVLPGPLVHQGSVETRECKDLRVK